MQNYQVHRIITTTNPPAPRPTRPAAPSLRAARDQAAHLEHLKQTQRLLPRPLPPNGLRLCVLDALTTGFWWCVLGDHSCERVEGEQGQPASCSVCGAHRLQWNPPAIVADVAAEGL